MDSHPRNTQRCKSHKDTDARFADEMRRAVEAGGTSTIVTKPEKFAGFFAVDATSDSASCLIARINYGGRLTISKGTRSDFKGIRNPADMDPDKLQTLQNLFSKAA